VGGWQAGPPWRWRRPARSAKRGWARSARTARRLASSAPTRARARRRSASGGGRRGRRAGSARRRATRRCTRASIRARSAPCGSGPGPTSSTSGGPCPQRARPQPPPWAPLPCSRSDLVMTHAQTRIHAKAWTGAALRRHCPGLSRIVQLRWAPGCSPLAALLKPRLQCACRQWQLAVTSAVAGCGACLCLPSASHSGTEQALSTQHAAHSCQAAKAAPTQVQRHACPLPDGLVVARCGLRREGLQPLAVPGAPHGQRRRGRTLASSRALPIAAMRRAVP